MSAFRERCPDTVFADQDASAALAGGAFFFSGGKMRKTSDIIGQIEKYAPLFLAASWDKSGIQVASGRREVSCLAVLLDPTPFALQKAMENGAEMVLSHHPLTMEPRYLDTLDSYHAAVSLLLRNDVPLYSAHTSLDANLDGPVSWLAGELDLVSLVPLEETAPPLPGGTLPCGFGFCGNLPQPMPYGVFLINLGEVLEVTRWNACGAVPETVRRVACCPGSGSSYAQIAFALGADVLITGDVKYHSALESPLRMLDVGHFCLEHTMMRLFAEQLAREMPDIAVTFFPSHDPLTPEHGEA